MQTSMCCEEEEKEEEGAEGKFRKEKGGGGAATQGLKYQPTRFSRTCTASSASSELVRTCETNLLPLSIVSFSLSLFLRTQKIYRKSSEDEARGSIVACFSAAGKESSAASSRVFRLHRFFESAERSPRGKQRNRYQ